MTLDTDDVMILENDTDGAMMLVTLIWPENLMDKTSPIIITSTQ